jgi:flavin-binding protein dodecin
VLLAAGPAAAQDVQQKLAAAKEAAARNQQTLRSYSWLEKTELFYKGDLKSTKVEACQYGLDGKLQKAPVVEPPPPEQKRGLRGKVAANKQADMKAELESSAALVRQYVPPDPAMMQAVANAGTVSMAQAGPEAVKLTFPGYVKAGDALSLTFEKAIKTLRQIDVTTWLDDEKNTVTLKVAMLALPDGTSYPGQITLSIPKSNVEVRITKTNYQKLAR